MNAFINWLEGFLEGKISKEDFEKIKNRAEREDVPVLTVSPYNSSNFSCIGKCRFPTPWFGTTPPNCETCGKQGYMTNITCNNIPNSKL